MATTLITGADDGLGFEAPRRLVALGPTVHGNDGRTVALQAPAGRVRWCA